MVNVSELGIAHSRLNFVIAGVSAGVGRESRYDSGGALGARRPFSERHTRHILGKIRQKLYPISIVTNRAAVVC